VFAKKAFVQRFASVRFDGVLAATERDDLMRVLRSAGATVTSWNACGAHTYATATLGPGATAESVGSSARAHVVSPPLAILRIAPDAPRTLAALEHALGGVGRPAGITECRRIDAALVIECDPRVTGLATLVALVDVELAHAPGRTIEPLVGLDDETLVAFAAALLAEPDLDAARLIEPHVARAMAPVAG